MKKFLETRDQLPEESYLLLDVREVDEFEEGAIEGARNLPLNQLVFSVEELREASEKGCTIFLYCHSGYRSERAKNLLQSMGIEDVQNIGGYSDYCRLKK